MICSSLISHQGCSPRPPVHALPHLPCPHCPPRPPVPHLCREDTVGQVPSATHAAHPEIDVRTSQHSRALVILTCSLLPFTYENAAFVNSSIDGLENFGSVTRQVTCACYCCCFLSNAEENCSTGSSERVNGCYSSFLLSNIHTRLRLVTGSSVPVLKLARETLVQWVGGCPVRVA